MDESMATRKRGERSSLVPLKETMQDYQKKQMSRPSSETEDHLVPGVNHKSKKGKAKKKKDQAAKGRNRDGKTAPESAGMDMHDLMITQSRGNAGSVISQMGVTRVSASKVSPMHFLVSNKISPDASKLLEEVNSPQGSQQNDHWALDQSENVRMKQAEVKNLVLETTMENFEQIGKLSYTQLQNHIRQNHPKKTNTENWSIWEDTGNLFNYTERRVIPKILKDIGLGASLYLLTIKAFIRFFFILNLMSIPIICIYMSGNEKDLAQSSGIGFLFGMLNLGNLGESGPKCKMQDLSLNEKSISLHCTSGKLNAIQGIGLSKKDDQQCNSETFNNTVTLYENKEKEKVILKGYVPGDKNQMKYYQNYQIMNEACSTYLNQDMLESSFISQIIEKFDSDCKGKIRCKISYDYTQIPRACLEEVMIRARDSVNKNLYNDYRSRGNNVDDYKKPEANEPVLFTIFHCDSQSVYMFRNENLEISKSTAALCLIFTDIMILTYIVLYYNLLSYMQRDFAEKYDNQTVEARDFTIVIHQLPVSFQDYSNETDIKFALWNDLQESISLTKRLGISNQRMDPTIININVVYTDNTLVNHQGVIMKKCDEIELQQIKLKRSKSQPNFLKTVTTIQEECAELKKQTTIHHQLIAQMLNENVVEDFDDDSDLYVEKMNPDIEEEQLEQQQEKFCFYEQIKQVYITFLSMETKEVMEKLYSETASSSNRRWLTKKMYDSSLNFFKKPSLKSIEDIKHAKWKQFMSSYSLVNMRSVEQRPNLKKDTSKSKKKQSLIARLFPKVEDEEIIMDHTCDPEFILWRNLGIHLAERKIYQVRSICFLAAIVALTFFVILFFKEYRSTLYADVLPVLAEKGLKGLSCSTRSITQKEAFDSYMRFMERQAMEPDLKGKTTVKLFCFCQSSMFNDFFKVEVFEDGQEYCQEWWSDFRYLQTLQLLPSFVIQIINVLSTFVFIALAKAEGHETLTIQNRTVFFLIFVQQFTSIGVVQIFTETNFEGFNITWYMTVGSSLCVSMMFNIFSTKLSELGNMFLILFTRCWDRSLKCSVKRRAVKEIRETPLSENENQNSGSDDGEEFEPNTQTLRQRDLQNLYTGPQMEAGEKFAQTFNAISIYLMYSIGLPILYSLAILFFVVAYWFNKIMLMRYYQKTFEFNEQLPISSTYYMQWGILLHIVNVVIKLSNKHLLQIIPSSSKHFEFASEIPMTEGFFPVHTVIYLAWVAFLLFLILFNQFVYNFNDDFIQWQIRLVARLRCQRQQSVKKYVFTDQENDLDSKKNESSKSKISKISSKRRSREGELEKHKTEKGQRTFHLQDKPANRLDSQLEGGSATKVVPLGAPVNTHAKRQESLQLSELENQFHDAIDKDIKKGVPKESPLSNLYLDIDQIENELNQIGVARTAQVDKKKFVVDSGKVNINKTTTINFEKDVTPQVKIPQAARQKSDVNDEDQGSMDLSEEESKINDGTTNKAKRKNKINANNLIANQVDLFKKGTLLIQENIEDIEDGIQASSNNFYCEILFDYLELFYKEALMTEASTFDRLQKVIKRVNMATLAAEVGRRFEKYYMSVVLRRSLIEQQVDVYYNYCKAIKSSRSNLDSLSRIDIGSQPSIAKHSPISKMQDKVHSASPASGFTSEHSLKNQIGPREYIERIQYLNQNFDESYLQQQHFPNNFRCTSFNQSYNVLHSDDYFNVDLAMERAKNLLASYLGERQDDEFLVKENREYFSD